MPLTRGSGSQETFFRGALRNAALCPLPFNHYSYRYFAVHQVSDPSVGGFIFPASSTLPYGAFDTKNNT